MPDLQAPHNLRTGRTAVSAALFPFKNLLTLIKLGLVPVLLAFAAAIIVSYLMLPSDLQFLTQQGELETQDAQETVLPAVNICRVVFSLLVIPFAVGIHRLIILGERPGWWGIRFSRYEFAFAVVAIIFFAGNYLLEYGVRFLEQNVESLAEELYPFDLILNPPSVWQIYLDNTPLLALTFTPLLIVFLVIHLRLAFVFPDAAVNGRISFASAWNGMKGNVLRFLAAFLLLAPVILVAYPALEAALLSRMTIFLALIISPAPRGLLSAWLVLSVAAFPLRAIALAMIAALISCAYRDLVGDQRKATATENAL